MLVQFTPVRLTEVLHDDLSICKNRKHKTKCIGVPAGKKRGLSFAESVKFPRLEKKKSKTTNVRFELSYFKVSCAF